MPTKAILDRGFQNDATEDGGFFGIVNTSRTELINGRFRLLSELGRGGMAVVHLAEDIATGKRFALKMMSTHLSGSAKQRFTREFSTIASLKHP